MLPTLHTQGSTTNVSTSAFLHNNKGIIDENIQYIAWTGKKKYTVNSWDEFINLRFEDLVLLDRVGLDATGLFDSKDMVSGILAMAKEKAKEQLVKRLGSKN